jgi:hypothetical protein
MENKKGEPVFKPIFRSGEYGKYRFYYPGQMSWYDRSGGSGNWQTINTGPDVANPELILPGLAESKKRLIPRRGLAKKAWQAASSRVKYGGTGHGMGISNIAKVDLNKSEVDPSVKLENLLKYAGAALKLSDASLNIAMENATNKLLYRIKQERAKQLGVVLKK